MLKFKYCLAWYKAFKKNDSYVSKYVVITTFFFQFLLNVKIASILSSKINCKKLVSTLNKKNIYILCF